MISSDLVDVSEVDTDSVRDCVVDVDSDEDSLCVFEGESVDDSEAECVDVELAVSDADNEVVLEGESVDVADCDCDSELDRVWVKVEEAV